MWIVADTEMPPMERLTILGVLELEDKYPVRGAESAHQKVVLNATYISVQVRVRTSFYILIDEIQKNNYSNSFKKRYSTKVNKKHTWHVLHLYNGLLLFRKL